MLVIDNLRKEYKSLVAVNDLSLHLEPGDIFGFIGPNGAGKTTTIRMLATLLTPTAGAAYVDGIDVTRFPEEVRSIVGYMPDFFGVYDDVKVWEYLDFFAAAYKIPRSERAQIIDDVLELTDLMVKKDAYVEELSRGMKQRLCLAKTLVHDPKLLLLDEPASGLDPRARVELRELLKELRNMGKTILVSSHILPELADFCNKIGIIEKGNLLLFGGVEEIMQQINGGQGLEIRLAKGDDMEKATAVLQAVPGVQEVQQDGELLRVAFDHALAEQHQLLSALITAGLRVESCAESRLDLEDLFMNITQGEVQ
ncbi:MAG: putative ABC transporter ATP-binding protein YbhF [bacterium ADurb.Bin429]|nr:MAG: putative ABC transporter ATP-binding protein YbhF [bacterium ADurb.Bin429]